MYTFSHTDTFKNTTVEVRVLILKKYINDYEQEKSVLPLCITKSATAKFSQLW